MGSILVVSTTKWTKVHLLQEASLGSRDKSCLEKERGGGGAGRGRGPWVGEGQEKNFLRLRNALFLKLAVLFDELSGSEL